METPYTDTNRDQYDGSRERKCAKLLRKVIVMQGEEDNLKIAFIRSLK